MNHVKRFAVVAAAAAAITLGVTTSASALTTWTDTPDSCGFAQFKSDGDNFRILDACKDGRGVRLEWTQPTKGLASTSDPRTYVDYTGGYNGLDFAEGHLVNEDFAEGACFYFRVGLEDGGTYVSGTYSPWELACA
ncbi:hypothetical protein [Streptomyces sp. NPDC005435]|uniref:hypothetical protein n=1 Tax=Streptomyces sp. NPDC005435 TaxID=3154464 RepID=UPI00345239D1